MFELFESMKKGYEELKLKLAELIQQAEKNLGSGTGAEKKAWVIEQADKLIKLPAFWDDILNVDKLALGFLIDKIVDAWNSMTGGNIATEGTPIQVAKLADAPVTVLSTRSANSAQSVDDRLNDLFQQYGIEREVIKDTPEKDIVTPAPETKPTLAPPAVPIQDATYNWQKCLKLVLGLEGGYSDHPADKGGATNYGITSGTFATAVSLGIIRGKSSVKDITSDDAAKIYYELYWKKCGGDKLQWYACYMVFDATVNGGIGMAARCVQESMNSTFDSRLAIDGKWGPKTQAALTSAFGLNTPTNAKMGQWGVSYLTARKSYYDRIIANNPSQKVFQKGWYNRLNNIAKHCGLSYKV